MVVIKKSVNYENFIVGLLVTKENMIDSKNKKNRLTAWVRWGYCARCAFSLSRLVPPGKCGPTTECPNCGYTEGCCTIAKLTEKEYFSLLSSKGVV